MNQPRNITPASGTTPASPTITASPASLPPGVYRGQITITGNAAGSPATLNTTLSLGAPADSTPPTVTLTSPSGGTVTGTVTLTATAADDSTTTLTYNYDPTGTLRQRTTQTKTTRYLLGGLFETDPTGTITATTIDGPAGNLARYPGPPTTTTPTSYLYYNGHGDLTAEADTTGTQTATHNYDPFGAPTQQQPPNTTNHLYTGAWNKQHDTTNNLILMGARPYDPTLGRFLTPDPIQNGSLNDYDYAGQDPINGYDLDGTLCWGCIGHAVTGAAIMLAPIAAGTVVGGVSGVFCGACGVFLGAGAAGFTTGLISSYHDHEPAGAAVRAELKDAAISLVADSALHALEAKTEAPKAGSEPKPASPAPNVRAIRIKPHTAAWATYHHG